MKTINLRHIYYSLIDYYDFALHDVASEIDMSSYDASIELDYLRGEIWSQVCTGQWHENE